MKREWTKLDQIKRCDTDKCPECHHFLDIHRYIDTGEVAFGMCFWPPCEQHIVETYNFYHDEECSENKKRKRKKYHVKQSS